MPDDSIQKTSQEKTASTGGSTRQKETSDEGTGGNKSSIPIRLTQEAAEKVEEIRFSEDIPDDSPLRVSVVGGGCAGFEYNLYFDENPPTNLDKTFKSHDVLIVVDQMSLMYLFGTEIDYVETLQATGFKFNNPNVSQSCGCGSSFNV